MEHNVDHLILQAAAITGQLAAIVGTQYIESHYFKTPYHTSILSGQGWVQELLDGHPEHICNGLGVHQHVFLALSSICETQAIPTHAGESSWRSSSQYSCTPASLVCQSIMLESAFRGQETVSRRPVFHSENISEFFQLRLQTSLAFFGLQPPLSSGDTSEYFLFQAPSSSPQHYCTLPLL